MDWDTSLINELDWSGNIINKEAKERVAKQIASKIKNGQVVGVGSGSTVYLALFAIAERIREDNIKISVIPSSLETSMACIRLGIPQTTLLERKPDWSFDGADEVDADNSLIKGRGGAMFKEKLLIKNSPQTFILVDESKLVDRLGSKFPIPVEVFPLALVVVQQKLVELGSKEQSLRLAQGKDGPIITENGNFILDVRFDNIDKNMETEIKKITGVIESGLFINYDLEIIVA